MKEARLRKQNYRDYYRRIDDENPTIVRDHIPMSKGTLTKLKRMATLRNVSVNYLIVTLIEKGLKLFNKGFKGCKLLSKHNLKDSKEF
ncbi:MAG: hypothetical protein HZA94_00120 [Candidatus Vogelbacteria bacterium]|nr:hypothetical protein [Candidatus Vogelbacteria bacterium]